jgi:hypothetical protein
MNNILAVIDYDGNVYTNPPALITTSCQINIADFPFDEQICNLVFGRLV